MNLIKKLITLVLMIVAPLISGKAFIEYANITYLNKKPSYPFGKELMKTIQVNDISFLANYQSEILSIGLVFLAVSVLAYISMMFKALINLVWLSLIILIGYYFYHLK